MNDNLVSPVTPKPPEATTPIGRRADLWATLLATLGAVLGVLAALWFFLGFAENDVRPEHLVSALGLTAGLFLFAVGPFAIVAGFARRAYRLGSKRAHLIWTLLLMLPWVILGTLAVTHTPLPIWCGAVATVLSTLLFLWALISFMLDLSGNGTKTQVLASQEDDVKTP